MELFKVLRADGRVYHGGNGAWPLPNGDEPGEWVEVKGKLKPCENGLHLCRIEDLPRWLGPAIFVAEADEEELILHGSVGCDSKVVVRRARLLRATVWTPDTAVVFAADCAEHVLHFFEEKYPNDDRPRKAIEAARKRVGSIAAARAAYAAAARAAADAAARAAYAADAAARAAADAAARAAYAAADAARAAADAADAAAAYAARAADAARAAADAAEYEWQQNRLRELLGC